MSFAKKLQIIIISLGFVLMPTDHLFSLTSTDNTPQGLNIRSNVKGKNGAIKYKTQGSAELKNQSIKNRLINKGTVGTQRNASSKRGLTGGRSGYTPTTTNTTTSPAAIATPATTGATGATGGQ